MAVTLWLNERPQFSDSNGEPLSGGKLYFYAAGSSVKLNTFTDSTGTVPNANPMILDASGYPQQAIWLTSSSLYKVGLTVATEPDPPTNFIWTLDNVTGIPSGTVSASEWVASGFTPTYVSATSFTVPGDQTSILTPRRAVQIVDAGGTKYGWIKTSVFTTLTTVVLDQNSTALASPVASVAYGLLSAVNPSIPILSDVNPIRSGSVDESKQWRAEVDQNTTGVTRVTTIPDYDHRMMTQTHGADIASAATLVLDTATGDLVDVTGTVAITAITLAEGREATVRFTGVLTLTNGASLVLPGGANITTAAGDFAVFRGYAAGVVRCSSYSPLSPASAGSSLALLSSKTASSSSQLTFTTTDFDWTAYDEYEFHFINIAAATNTALLQAQVSTNAGSSYDSTVNYTELNETATGAALTVSTGSGQTAWRLTAAQSSTSFANGRFIIYAPAVVATKFFSTEKMSYLNSGGPAIETKKAMHEWLASTAAINGIRFFESSGNIASGTIRAYGLKKS